MTREERVEKLKIEYSLFECENAYHLEYVVGFIKNLCDVCNITMDRLAEASVGESVSKIISICLGKAANSFGLFNPVFYTDSKKLVAFENDIVRSCRDYLERLHEVVNDDNIQNVYRLARFTVSKHGDSVLAVNRIRCAAREKGACYLSLAHTVDGDYDVFGDFFDAAIKEVSCVEKPQFSKK